MSASSARTLEAVKATKATKRTQEFMFVVCSETSVTFAARITVSCVFSTTELNKKWDLEVKTERSIRDAVAQLQRNLHFFGRSSFLWRTQGRHVLLLARVSSFVQNISHSVCRNNLFIGWGSLSWEVTNLAIITNTQIESRRLRLHEYMLHSCYLLLKNSLSSEFVWEYLGNVLLLVVYTTYLVRKITER